MLDALKDAKVPHEKFVKYREGRGFYNTANRVELYTKLAKFIDTHIGE